MERLIDGETWPALDFTPISGSVFAAAVQPLPVSISDAGIARFHRLCEQLATSHGELAQRLRQPMLAPLFQLICDHSPYLIRLIERDPDFLKGMLDQVPSTLAASIIAELGALPASTDEATMMRRLRQAKSKIALLVGLADLGRVWPLGTICRTLSDFADICVERATASALAPLIEKAELGPEGDVEAIIRQCGYVVFALGKQGGRELNYSSDIDLIVLYDEEKLVWRGSRAVEQALVRVTQRIRAMLQDLSADGYVFRVDLRLRPDPGSTPVAMSMGAAESYYQSIGQPWERSALIKARAVAGDLDAGAGFLERIRPFIWRRHLDFAAIADIHQMKQRIHEHHGLTELKLAGHDAKIGIGGIREIEFFASIHQMISGGKRPELRVRASLDVLDVLAREHDIGRDEHADLVRAYRLLRMVEHRLQMIDDQQTQRLPDDPEKLRGLARFLGWEQLDDFTAAYEASIRRVNAIYRRLMPDREGDVTLPSLAELGFRDLASAGEILDRWRAGRYRALATPRAHSLMLGFLPRLLAAFAEAADPDQALARFDQLLGRLPAGVQLFSLFEINPSLFDLVARIMAVAPALAEQLTRKPALLDSVFAGDFFVNLPELSALDAELAEKLDLARDYQDVLDDARVWLGDRRFQLGVLLMDGLIDAVEAGAHIANLADATLKQLLPRVEAEFAAHGAGRMPGGSLAVLAVGSYGERTLSYLSDLDLIFVYDAPETGQSDGRRPLSPSQYYSRLVQRIISSLSARTSEGMLFEVDMRLRPSGRSGVIAVSRAAFLRYQLEEAWGFELLALAKTRVVATDRQFAALLDHDLDQILARGVDFAKLQPELADIRRRMDDEFGTGKLWALKTGRGGLTDIDFIVGGLSLGNAAAHPELARADFATRLAVLERIGMLKSDEATRLRNAQRLLHATRSLARLLIGDAHAINQAPAPVAALLARQLGFADLGGLAKAIDADKNAIHQMFDQLYPPNQPKEA